MVRIIYIGTENKKRLNVIYKLENILLNKISYYNYNKVIINLPSDVIDLIILNIDKCNGICHKIKSNNSLKHIPLISLVKDLENIKCESDLVVSDNVSDIEFLYQLNLLIKMKIIKDELKKETILSQLKITDRNIQLETKTERLRRAELFSKSGNWEYHIESEQIISSEGAMVIYDIDKNIISHDEIKKFTLPEYREHLDNAMYDLLYNDKPYDIEYKIKIKKGEIKDIHSSAIYNKDKKIIFGVIQDITNKKKTEKNLEKSLSLLKATLESTADGILVVDTKGKIIEYNQKFLDIWGIPDDIISKKDDNLALSYVSNNIKNPDKFLKMVKILYNNNIESSLDIIEFKDGRFIETYSLPQKINNVSVGRVWSYQDITEKKIKEEELIKAKEKAEESNRLKNEFLDNMTHEIRTPMNSILGFSSLISDKTNHDKLNEYIEIIKNSGTLLMSIIESIIDLSEIQTGIFKINYENVNIKDMFILSEEEYNQHLKFRNKSNLIIKLNIPIDELILYSDGKRIKQVLNNLIINAIKFTEIGYIEYGYIIKDKYLEIYVKDTGIGISKDNIKKIFERFYQVTHKNVKKYNGAGLGLTISKSIVEKLNGELIVNSELGIGSTFKFIIPIIKGSPTNEVKNYNQIDSFISDWSDKDILIIEDNKSNYFLLEILLGQTKINITHVDKGEDFFKIIKDNKFNIILLDLQLPDISGFEILEYIKKYTDTPVIIQSAFVTNDNIKKANELKVDDYISKPIIWTDLYNVLKKHIM